jgi:hypothetical protein
MSEIVLGETHAFVVRIWCESADEVGNTLTYRGVITDVTTGRQMGFENLQTLATFICEEAKLPELDQEDQVPNISDG